MNELTGMSRGVRGAVEQHDSADIHTEKSYTHTQNTNTLYTHSHGKIITHRTHTPVTIGSNHFFITNL